MASAEGVAVLRLVPETKGRRLEDIEEVFADRAGTAREPAPAA